MCNVQAQKSQSGSLVLWVSAMLRKSSVKNSKATTRKLRRHSGVAVIPKYDLNLSPRSLLIHTVLFKLDIFLEQYIHERILTTRLHDQNGNGQLSPSEFASLLSSLHLKFAQEDIDALAKKYDVNKNGNIDYIELQHGLLGNYEDHGSPKHMFRRSVTYKSQISMSVGRLIVH